MDEEACPAVAPTKDAPGVASSVRPTTGVAVCMDDGPSCAVSTNDVMVAPGHATSIEDALGTASPICPTVDAPAYVDDSSGRAISTCDVTATPGHAPTTMGALDVPSFVVDVAISCASRSMPLPP